MIPAPGFLNGRSFLGLGLFGDGSASLPSIAFAAEPTLGLFRKSAGVIGIAKGGAEICNFSDSGGPVLAAVGANKNVTISPSGTGTVLNHFATRKFVFSELNAGVIYLHGLATATAPSSTNYLLASSASNLNINAPGGSEVDIRSGGTLQARFVGQHVLLGGLTTDGTGVLQFPTATTTAGGISFGTDTWISRTSNPGILALTGGSNAQWATFNAGTQVAGFGHSGTSAILVSLIGSVIISANNTTALTLDSSQNATFAGVAAFAGAAVSASTGANHPAGTAALSPLRIPHGVAPTAPVNGDVWTTVAGLFVRINGATIGPLT